MSVFPQLSMNPEVREHLRNVYTNNELVFEALLSCLSHPPLFTCLRASTHLHSLQDIQHRLQRHLAQQERSPSVYTHPQLPDVLLLPVHGPRPVDPLASEVIVGAQCGNAVLRGAHVFTPGILSTPKYMKVGEVVSVFSDVEGKCTRGAKEFKGKKVFLGNGISEVDRSEIFSSDGPGKGVAIRMTEPLYQSPSFDGVLTDQLFLQNLPSVVVGHALGPRPGERILDMCAAPGGKTTHIASLMGNQGTVVALEKIRSKMEKIVQNAKMLQLHCIKAYCCNSVHAVIFVDVLIIDLCVFVDGPPYPEESFDRILLDAPCSGYVSSLQRFCVAVRLLKRGGVLVYSTCTVTLAENEEQVAWALKTFPCLTLEPQVRIKTLLKQQAFYNPELSTQTENGKLIVIFFFLTETTD
uniref:SAM-dependent MTase RsmB/NOP-type domain-containing protein n=1 Tax=Sinocyclocheilus grahami TaxID=75366 RepID=A0A672P675_SINGR